MKSTQYHYRLFWLPSQGWRRAMNNKFILRLRQCDHYIIAASLLLFLTGMAGLISVSRDDQTFLSREVLIQSVALILGLIAASAILTLGYRYFLDLEKIIYIAGIIFLLSVYIPGLGKIGRASCRERV